MYFFFLVLISLILGFLDACKVWWFFLGWIFLGMAECLIGNAPMFYFILTLILEMRRRCLWKCLLETLKKCFLAEAWPISLSLAKAWPIYLKFLSFFHWNITMLLSLIIISEIGIYHGVSVFSHCLSLLYFIVFSLCLSLLLSCLFYFKVDLGMHGRCLSKNLFETLKLS